MLANEVVFYYIDGNYFIYISMALLKKTKSFQQGGLNTPLYKNKSNDFTGPTSTNSFAYDDHTMAKGEDRPGIQVKDAYPWVDSSWQPPKHFLESLAKTKNLSLEEAKREFLERQKRKAPNQYFRFNNNNKLQIQGSTPVGDVYESNSGHWYTKGTDITPAGYSEQRRVDSDEDPRKRMGASTNNERYTAKKAKGGKLYCNAKGRKLLIK